MKRNVAHSCFRFPQVQWLFAQCLAVLEMRGPSLLQQDPEVNLLQDLCQY